VKKTKVEKVDRFSGFEPTDLSPGEQSSVIALALRVLEKKHAVGECIQSPADTKEYLRLRVADYQNEVFGAMFLDSRHRVLAVRDIFQGTIDSAAVHPRVVVQQALKCNAQSTIFYHNHPSGVAEPSTADKAITKRLKDVLSMIDVRVLDHFVISATESISFAEQGLI